MTGAASAAAPADNDRSGLIAGLVCYSLWGLLPLLFGLLERAGVQPFALVAWRTVFSLPVAAGLVLGIAQEVSTPVVGFTYKIALAFAVMLVVLLVRPRGLFGRVEAVGPQWRRLPAARRIAPY